MLNMNLQDTQLDALSNLQPALSMEARVLLHGD